MSHQLQFVCPWSYHVDVCSEEESGDVIEVDLKIDIFVGDVFDNIQTKQNIFKRKHLKKLDL
jgi:hypothetical protein